MSLVKNSYQVNHDSENMYWFSIHKEDVNINRFVESPRGLYWLNAKEKCYMDLINTVDNNKSSYTHHYYLKVPNRYRPNKERRRQEV